MDVTLLIASIALLLGLVNLLFFVAVRNAVLRVMEEMEREKKFSLLGANEEEPRKALSKVVKQLKELIATKYNIKGATHAEVIRRLESSANLPNGLKKELVVFFTKLIEAEYSPESRPELFMSLRNEAIRLMRKVEASD